MRINWHTNENENSRDRNQKLKITDLLGYQRPNRKNSPDSVTFQNASIYDAQTIQ